MNVYDFDGTIYSGDSTLDFYFYCLSHNIMILKKIPIQMRGVFFYIIGKIDKTEFKEHFYSFLTEIPHINKEVNDFWEKNQKKIKIWYLNNRKFDDVIISASPCFLLKPICERLGNIRLIASDVDEKTGKYTGHNCYGEEKARRFADIYPDSKIDNFYSDTKSDIYLAKLACKSYIVEGEKIYEWKR